MRSIRSLWIPLVVTGLYVGTPSEAQAQCCCGAGGCGPGMQQGAMMYDPATVETVRGEITAIQRVAMRHHGCGGAHHGGCTGVHLMLKSGDASLSIHLGPAWFIDNQGDPLAVGDEIEIKGSRVTYEGEPAVIAAEIKRGDAVLKLRDEKGYPVWGGWRRGTL